MARALLRAASRLSRRRFLLVREILRAEKPRYFQMIQRRRRLPVFPSYLLRLILGVILKIIHFRTISIRPEIPQKIMLVSTSQKLAGSRP